MTEQPFTVLADILGLAAPDRDAAHAVAFHHREGTMAAADIINRLRRADAAIRGAYVIHGPMEFRITVGHRDTHRAPGTIKLGVGDTVRPAAIRRATACDSARIRSCPKRPGQLQADAVANPDRCQKPLHGVHRAAPFYHQCKM